MPRRQPKEPSHKVLTFRFDELYLGLRIESIRKVTRLPKIHKSATAPLGIAMINAEEVLVLDLYQNLYHKDIDYTDTSAKRYFITLQQENILYGIPTLQMPSLREVPISRLQSTPPAYRTHDPLGVASHVFQLDQQTFFLLEPQHLLQALIAQQNLAALSASALDVADTLTDTLTEDRMSEMTDFTDFIDFNETETTQNTVSEMFNSSLNVPEAPVDNLIDMMFADEEGMEASTEFGQSFDETGLDTGLHNGLHNGLDTELTSEPSQENPTDALIDMLTPDVEVFPSVVEEQLMDRRQVEVLPQTMAQPTDAENPDNFVEPVKNLDRSDELLADVHDAQTPMTYLIGDDEITEAIEVKTPESKVQLLSSILATDNQITPIEKEVASFDDYFFEDEDRQDDSALTQTEIDDLELLL